LIATRTIDPLYIARGHLTPPSDDGQLMVLTTAKTLIKDRIINTCQHITIIIIIIIIQILALQTPLLHRSLKHESRLYRHKPLLLDHHQVRFSRLLR
jgi:hypothetical protein